MVLARNELPLLEVVRHSDTLIFAGSGLSRWSGLPDWNRLLLRLIEDAERRGRRTRLVRDAHATGDLLDTADKLADVLTPLEMAGVMRQDLAFADARPHPIHALLTRLGPERFVTTNYDSLIEQQLGLEGRRGSYRIITNRQVAELADIQKASADQFVFKPHGDIEDAESLVLSTTHYNRIMLGADNPVRSVLETLFVSRPILFVGYGLRDPDTMLILRALRERYLGAAGEFWAIMADADDELADFWRRNHRVQLISYPTRRGPAGVDHGALLDLLRRLVEAREAFEESSYRRGRGSPQPAPGIELARYAARLSRPEPAVRLPLSVSLRQWIEGGPLPGDVASYHGAELLELLGECPGPFVLEGPAGSGKSFAITTHLSRAGREVLDWCLAENHDRNPPAVPVLLDARLYRGSFATLAKATVPPALDLHDLSRRHKIVLYVDSLDEMPAEHLEAARWRADILAFARQFQEVAVVYGTRRRDLVGDRTLPCFGIELLEEHIVEEALAEVGRLRENMSNDLFAALRTPFTLMLGRRVLGRQREISTAPTLLGAFVSQAMGRISHPTSSKFLQNQLGALAADIIGSGRETVQIDLVAERLKGRPQSRTAKRGPGRGRVDRLVDAGLLTSEIDDHVRFVHRSVTEFLAAQELVRRWRAGQVALANLLSSRHWDNPVAWAAASLSSDEADCTAPRLASRG